MNAPPRRHPLIRTVKLLWRERLRPAWRDARPLVAALATIAVFVLGTIGFRHMGARDGHPESVLDALYRSLALFDVNAGEITPPVYWTVNVARFLAPVLVGYAVVSGLLVLFGERLRRLRIHLFARSHVVVAGLGRMGLPLALAFHDQGWRVIVVAAAQDAEPLAICREHGITVLAGDARESRLLAQARLDRARYLIGVCGADGANVELVVAAAAAMRERRSGVLNTLAHLEDPGLWRMLKAEAISGLGHAHMRVEFFNVDDLAARMLVAERPAFPPMAMARAPRRPHVMVVGLAPVADALIRELARQWQNSRPGDGEALRITVVSEEAEAEHERLLARYPELTRICEVRAADAPLGVELQRGSGLELDDERPVSAVYVCIRDEATALETTLALRARPELQAAAFTVAVDHRRSGLASLLHDDPGTTQGVYGFGVLDRVLDVASLLRGTTEEIARAKHEEYVLHQAARGVPMGEGLMVPWEQLSEAWKETNRAFADGIAAKLAAARCVVVPAPLLSTEEALFSFEDTEVEGLARLEHERWTEEKLRTGWRYGPQRDDERKLHPLLVPWEKLPESERNKDRDPVREIPRMLARAGLEILRVGPPQAGEPGPAAALVS